MAFDPMTGEPINDDRNNNMGFDPMTGEPLGRQSGGFDPMTGQPLGRQPDMGFDPMTGEPLGRQPDMGFDPMTGEPLGRQSGGFDPMTGQPLNNKAKGNKNALPIIIGIVAAVVFIGVGLVTAALTSGLFLGKSGKVLLAMYKTFKDKPHFAEVLEPLSALSKDKYTIAFSCEIKDLDMKVSGEARVKGVEKQVSAVMDCDGYPKIEVLGSIDGSTVKGQIPLLSKYVFTYNFKGKNTGDLADILGDEMMDDINAALEFSAKGNDEIKKIQKQIVKVFTRELKSLQFTNAEKKEYTVDDKDVTCKGYKTAITGDNMTSIVDGIEDVVNENFASLSGNEMFDTVDLTASFDSLRDQMGDMEDIDLTFYIYKSRLAAIIIGVSGEEVEFCFEGGDYRMQNMTLKADDYRIQISGEDTGSKETFTLKARSGRESQEIGSLEYNYENGKFSVDISGSGISGKLTNGKSGVVLKISEIYQYGYSFSPNLEMAVQKGAKIEKYSGKEFDLGNADKGDLEDLVKDIQDKMYDNDLYDLLESSTW